MKSFEICDLCKSVENLCKSVFTKEGGERMMESEKVGKWESGKVREVGELGKKLFTKGGEKAYI